MTPFNWANYLRQGEQIVINGRFSQARLFRGWAVYTAMLLLTIWRLTGADDPKASMVRAVLTAVAVACLAIGALVAMGLGRAYYCVTDRRSMTAHEAFWRQTLIKELPVSGTTLEVRDGQVSATDPTSGRTIGWSVSRQDQERIQNYMKQHGVR